MNTWYTQLNRPPLTPPSWIFGPVWSILYIMIALSFILYVLKTRQNPPYLVYGVLLIHMAANLGWSGIFFGLRKPGWALLDILLLDVTLIAMVYIFWHAQKFASILLWPYLAWVLFATYLNAGFYWLNQ